VGRIQAVSFIHVTLLISHHSIPLISHARQLSPLSSHLIPSYSPTQHRQGTLPESHFERPGSCRLRIEDTNRSVSILNRMQPSGKV
jgi:hypothetical protein